MKEVLRFRCPLCGMLPEVDRVNGDNPYEVNIYLQRIGGSVSLLSLEEKQRRATLETRGRGRPKKQKKIKGLITYEEIGGDRVEEVKQQINSRIRQLKVE